MKDDDIDTLLAVIIWILCFPVLFMLFLIRLVSKNE